MTEDKTLYILRYYLPMEPYVTPDITKQRFRELMDFCHECDVKAVMFYVAFRSDWYYMPDSTEHASIWAENMTPFIREMRKNGISYQLNFQNLIGGRVGLNNLAHRRHVPRQLVANAEALHTLRFEKQELRDVLVGQKQHGFLLMFFTVENHSARRNLKICNLF